MANKITYVFEFDDKGRVKVEGLTKGFIQLETAMKKIAVAEKERQAASSSANKAMGNTISNAGLAGAVLTELGRTISDSNYGIRGMANNLSQLSTLLVTFIGKQEETGLRGVKAALGGLVRQLAGPLGLILLFQIVVQQIEKFSMKSEEAARKSKGLTKELDEQLDVVSRLSDEFEKYTNLLSDLGGDGGDALLDLTISRLRFASKEFDRLYKGLEKNDFEFVFRPYRDGTEAVLRGAAAQQMFFKTFQDLLKVRREMKILSEDETGTEEAKINRRSRLNTLIDRAIRLEEDLGIRQKNRTEDTSDDIKKIDEELEAFLSKDLGLDITINDLEFKNTEFPDFIDDLDEYVDGFLEQQGKASLTQKILGLEPASRKKDLKALEREIDMRFTPLLRQTDEYRAAVKAINDKWDEKDEKALDEKNKSESKARKLESKARFDHWNELAKGFASFMNNIALLNEGNKDLARASIIASAAATSVGIWESWLVKDPTFSPAPIKVAGAIATQAAVIASTAAALKSLNTETPIGGAGSAATGSSAAPQFNVVGQEVGQMGQLASAITGQTGEPVRAYVVLDDVNSAAELDNKITTSGSIG